ncbi:hypothetical protein Hanom_Chr17g01544141 [Helianthus anomalus]
MNDDLRSLRFPTGAEVTGPKNFYKTKGSITDIPKNFYTKTTYSPLLSEKFGGSAALQSFDHDDENSEAMLASSTKIMANIVFNSN